MDRRAPSRAPSRARARRASASATATVALLALAACTSPGSTGAGSTTGAAPPATTAASPSAPDASLPPDQAAGVAIPPGQVERAVAQLPAVAEDVMRRSRIPGMAIAVVHGGEVVYRQGFGVRKVGEPGEVTPETVFQLASVSKPIGSTVVAREVTKGTVDWTTPIRQLMPWFALRDPYVTRTVTVGDLYAHRSGLPGEMGDDLEDLGFTRRQILERLRLAPAEPYRITFGYANYGITAAAEAVATKAGKDWATLSQDELYGPLGMTSTSSRFADYERRPDRAWTHVLVDGEYRAQFVRDPDQQSPAGGVSSSVDDLARWVAMLLADGRHEGEQLVSPDALLPAMTPQIAQRPPANVESRPESYGFGWDVNAQPSGRTQTAHSGAFALGAATNVLLLPSADVGIISLTNAAPVGAPETVDASFADLVQFGRVTRDWYALYNGAFEQMATPPGSLVGKQRPDPARPPQPLSAYVGTYQNSYYGPLQVRRAGSGLELVLGPKGEVFPLRPWDGDVFAFDLRGEAAGGLGGISKATFSGTGRARSVVLEFYDSEGLGTFRR